MYRTPVSSTNICSIGYDSQSAILEVEFTSGDVYQYFNIPEHLYRGLMSASSKGQFLNDYIRNSYRYQKIS
ncbi:MAG: KTSC domain-containing protein [Candidatus Niyogibacteria bacterium CG10_big_fil_rev_8_21_14_0_10_42_19]|uniref:KTSC domain-containing protein n=1 Tax=Candidatus Niyogibacteria bacterium CG10_big_fil_rev_8_21_14_0_10_42_19 TaxID=1974725 RepID=A0A2H0TFU4_9BACT|nr:MAG: KTSC domain-containing protein [Candidatus Niyogibacteria bacterium CG10_big_fil_rev_8_21_14_0_10_42_19]